MIDEVNDAPAIPAGMTRVRDDSGGIEHPEGISAVQNLLHVPLVESVDITEAMIYLCGHGGRYITGITMPIDAGTTAK